MRFPPLFRGALAPRHPRPAPHVRPPRRDVDEFEALFAQLLEDMTEGATLTHVRVIPRGAGVRGHHADRVWIDEAL